MKYGCLKATFLVAAFSAGLASQASAQDSASQFDDARFQFHVGGQLFTNYSTQLRIDSETFGFGTEIELEEELSVEDSLQIGRLDATLRIGGRSSLAMSYYDIARDGTRPTQRDIQFGDTFYPAGTPVQTEFNQEVIKAAYRFRFLRRPRAQMSASIGLHTMLISTAVRSLDGSRVEEQDADAPLPVFGLQGAWQFGEKWQLNGSTEWFDVKSGDFQGTFMDAIVSVEHQTFERIGFGFGINRFLLDVEAGDADLRGLVEVQFDAGILYMKGSFGSID